MKKDNKNLSLLTQELGDNDTLSQVANKLVVSTRELMRKASTEEDLRIGFEKALEPIRNILGIISTPKYEKTIYKSGRADSIHGQVIIEYEAPNAFNSKRWIEHAFEQLIGYIKGEAQQNKDTLFLFDPKFVGVGFDGFFRIRLMVWFLAPLFMWFVWVDCLGKAWFLCDLFVLFGFLV